ncbi:sigma 54-interacting transcriptional regulator [bacterium]|nr:sigma 54-interacting transcriptional regulator [bacterium]
MERKKIVIVTGNDRVASSIEDDVRLILGDSVIIEKMFPPQVAEMEHVEGDLFLLTRLDRIGNLEAKVQDKGRMLCISRTIWESGLQQILAIPPQSKVLVVNDSLKSTLEMQKLLLSLNVPGLTYIPYSEDSYDPSLTVAITPGEPSYVPPYIEKIIDVGNRHIDISTALSICNILKANTPETYEALLRYMSLVITPGNTTKRYQNALIGNMRMESILQHMEQGLLLTLSSGEVVLANPKLEQLANCSTKNELLSLRDLFPEPIAQQLEEMKDDAIALNLGGREIVVNHTILKFSTNIHQRLYFFSDVTYLRYLEQSAEMRAKKSGFVAKHTFNDIVHRSVAMKECIRQLRMFAESDKSILIQGESGTGKELLAQSVHNSSPRHHSPFVAVNCAALPESLLESELFGYEKGAFTGARQSGKMGLFEQANGGTIFLDEIGDMPVALQSRLLRVLQEKQVMRIGGDYVVNVNVRVIAATNQDLMQKINEGMFRHDLFYRLCVLPCQVPALRERREDILPLFQHFTGLTNVPDDIADRLMRYDWPGNVRELQNAADYYGMMSEFENPLPKHISGSVPQSLLAASEIDYAVLSILYEGSLGRTALIYKLKERGMDMTEYALRHKLEDLEHKGILVRQIGRGGTALTDKGKDVLKKLQARH